MLKKFKIYLLLTSLIGLNYSDLLTGTRDTPATSVATNSKPISQSNIANQTISTTPNGLTYTITRSGQYYLTGSLNYSPQITFDTVIIIAANDVVLDLASYTISSDDSKTGLNCIDIASGYSNIHILNGRISKMTGKGINISSGCSLIYLSDLTINDCDLGGIVATTASNIFLDNVNIANCNGNSTNDAIGMLLTDITFFSAKNCTFNSCVNTLNNGMGVKLVNSATFCNDCSFESCAACHNGTDFITGSAYGFRIISSRTCTFKNCSATDNSVAALNSYGFSFENGYNNMCYNCLAASNKTVNISGTAYGFYLSGTTNHYLEECEARNQDAVTSSAASAYGFYSTAGTGNSFYKCNGHGNRAGTSSSSIAAGFALENGETRSTIEDSDASANQGGSGTAYGIKLGQTSGTQPTFCFINNNRLMNNFGTSAQYGLKDFSSNSKNLITRNQSFAQGPVLRNTVCTDTGFMNFMISYASTANNINNILVEGDRAELKVFSTAGPLDNLSIFYSEDIS
jgi:hypothetical protein